jgi:hypothetical protein
VEVRCQARILLASGSCDTTTEDIGSRGCRVVLPAPAKRGDPVGVVLGAPRYPLTLRVDGRVAWVSPQAPWRVGIAYAAQVLPEAARWYEGLRQSVPELFSLRRPLQRLPVDSMIFLGPVPSLSDFREDEVVVLRTIGSGIRVGDLRTALSRTWPRMHRALFTLLAQGHVIVSRALATHPVKWKHILGEPLRAGSEPVAAEGAEDDLELVADGLAPIREELTASATPHSSRITAKLPVFGGGHPVSRRISEGIEPIEAPPARAASPRPTPLAAPRPAAAQAGRTPTPPPLPRQVPPAPDFSGAGVGWRAPAGLRSPEADDLLKLALAELEAHRSHGALALLRRALSLAPGDPEIATAIGRAMRRDDPASS